MRSLSLTAMVGVSLLSTMAILTWRALSVMMQNRVISAVGGRGAIRATELGVISAVGERGAIHQI